MQFTVEDKHVIQWLRLSKNYEQIIMLAQNIFWQKMKFYWVKDDTVRACEVFNFGDLVAVSAVCGRRRR